MNKEEQDYLDEAYDRQQDDKAEKFPEFMFVERVLSEIDESKEALADLIKDEVKTDE